MVNSIYHFTYLTFSISILQTTGGIKRTTKLKKRKATIKQKTKPNTSNKISSKDIPAKERSVKKSTKRRSVVKPSRERKPQAVRKPILTKRTTQGTQRPTKKGDDIPDELQWLREDPHELLLSRFIETPKGTKLGESIGIDKSRLILKNKLNFYSIPLKSVREKGDKLVLRRKVNWKSAARLGETWRKETLDVIKTKSKKPKGVKKTKTK